MKKVSFLLILFSLTGCAVNQKFDCPFSDGVRCLSLSEVDKKVNSGQIGSNKVNKEKTKPLSKLEPEVAPYSPLRTPEEVLSIWIAPYQTEDGSLHEEKRIHFVAKPATWVGAPVEIKEENS